MTIRIIPGDCRDVLKTITDESVDSIVTDPPYELGFMGKGWDSTGIANSVEVWAEALRVLKPGGHLLAFSGTRTYHRMVCAIEDAGFEIRDQIGWLYGSGFPKSLDVSKAIDRARDDRPSILRVTTLMAEAAERAGVTRADVDAAMGTSDMGGWWLSRLAHRCQCPKWEQWLQLKVLLALSDELDAEVWRLNGRKGTPGNERHDRQVSDPAGNDVFQPTQRVINPGTPVLDAARQWQGWGTALKPAWEPIVVARKPLIGTVAANVLAHGTGALNIDGCRVAHEEECRPMAAQDMAKFDARSKIIGQAVRDKPTLELKPEGRWPANIIHDGSDEVIAAFPQAGGALAPVSGKEPTGSGFSGVVFGEPGPQGRLPSDRRDGGGSAARFFYTAKASAADRHEGLQHPGPQFRKGSTLRDAENVGARLGGNHHPTVKPTDLMRYLCRLVTPPGGTVLDPFAGSGSTLKAAELEGFSAIGIELDPAYIEIAKRRIAADMPLFAEVTT